MAVVGEARARERLLTCRVGRKICGLRLEQVVETMRALPVEPLPAQPRFVTGLAMIRGRPTPVVDARVLLGGDEHEGARRYVTLRFGGTAEPRVAALAVDEVLDVIDFERQALDRLPQLLKTAQGELVSALSSLDNELLLVLEHARIVPEALWAELEQRERRA